MNYRLAWASLSSLSFSSKVKLIFILLLTILAATFDLLYILIPSTFVSRYLSSDSVTGASFNLSTLQLPTLIAYFLIALTLSTLLRIFCISFIARSSVAISHEITLKLFNSLISGPYLRFTQYPKSTLKNIFLAQTGQLTSGIINPSLQAFSVFITISTVSFFLLKENPRSTSLLLASAFSIYCFVFIFSKRIVSRLGTISRNSSNIILSSLADIFSGFRQVFINSDQEYFIQKYSSLNLTLRTAEANSYIAVSAPRFIIEYLIVFFICLLVLIFLGNGVDPLPFVTDLLTYFFAAQRILPLLQSFFSSINLVAYAKSSIADYTSLLHQTLTKPHPQLLPSFSKFTAAELDPSILFSLKVDSFKYQDPSSPLFSGEFTFYQSSIALITGPSGSGKSTLIDILTGLIQDPSISFSLNPSLFNYSSDKWSSLFSICPQQPVFFDDTVFNNVSFPHSSSTCTESVLRSLYASGFTQDECNAFAKKRISSEYSPLSGGQMKRLGLARAIHISREILVLDEPTSGLDTYSESRVYRSIQNLRSRYRLIIIISHSQVFNSLADYTYVLDGFSRYQ